MLFLMSSSLHHLHLHQLCRLVLFIDSWISEEALPPIGFCLIWCGVTIFIVGVVHLPLFHIFEWFNIKATPPHYSIIQKEVDELLAKDATEPSSGGAGFYSNILAVPKCTGELCPILSLK